LYQIVATEKNEKKWKWGRKTKHQRTLTQLETCTKAFLFAYAQKAQKAAPGIELKVAIFCWLAYLGRKHSAAAFSLPLLAFIGKKC